MEVAEPSLRIWNDSMSSEFRPAMAELINVVASPDDKELASTFSIMTPSTTHRGLESPKIEVAPLTLILGAVPNVPDTFCTETPADFPSSERLTSPTPLIFTSTAESWSVAPVKSRLSVVVIPVTTASESISVLVESTKSTFSAAGLVTLV